jgi:hypothetical protein
MVEKQITNCPTEPIRWSLKAICREFQVNRVTLQRRMTEAKVIAGKDGLYSTRDILIALTGGDYLAERLRKIKAEATNMELRNQERRRLLLPAKSVETALIFTFAVMKNEIWSSSMTESEKRSVLSHLVDINFDGCPTLPGEEV